MGTKTRVTIETAAVLIEESLSLGNALVDSVCSPIACRNWAMSLPGPSTLNASDHGRVSMSGETVSWR